MNTKKGVPIELTINICELSSSSEAGTQYQRIPVVLPIPGLLSRMLKSL